MRRLSLLMCLVVLSSSCKPLHDRQGLDPVSDTDYAVSDGGILLTAIRGSQVGICIVRSWSNKPKEDAQLVTERGALSDQQLKSILGFMGYGDIAASAIIGAVVGGGAVLAITPKAALGPGFLGGTAAFFAGIAAVAGHRTTLAKSEGEKWEDIFMNNTVRLRKLLSDKEGWKVSDKKMRKMLEKMRSITPDYPDQCKHMAYLNKRRESE